MKKNIVLYGSKECHKTNYYMTFLSDRDLVYTFHDVLTNKEKAAELKSLYESGKLNFPTLLLGDKKLRNPSDRNLGEWLDKMKNDSLMEKKPL